MVMHKVLNLSYRNVKGQDFRVMFCSQVKRFTNDLLKVLKAQPSKQISILDLPICFEKAFTRIFKITDYGVSF